MKKLLMFLCCVFAMNGALANCKVSSCDKNLDNLNGRVPTHLKGNQCWWCGPGPNSCNNNDIVTQKDEVGDVIWLWQCQISFGAFSNKFSDFTPGEFCAGSEIKSTTDPNAKVTYSVKDESKTVRSEFGDWYINDGSASCIYVKCKENYKPSSDKQRCVSVAESECQKGDGIWSGFGCSCSHKGDYEWSESQKKCVLNAAGKQKQQEEQNRQRQQQQQQQQREQQKQNCIKSGGDYTNGKCTCRSEKNLVLSNGICECTNADYEFKSASVGCVEKDDAARRRKCESSTDSVYWNGSECICNEPDMVFVYGKGKCEELADAKICKAAKDTTWNGVSCQCNKTGYVWRNMECVESDELIQEREDSANKAAATSITLKVRKLNKNISEKLDGWRKNLTVWKTAEGDFNAARLASDSIAGVVLGTAGGLITSSIVKKNQVKTGFEDISCTIGGQTVAGWHDEFTVGIK